MTYKVPNFIRVMTLGRYGGKPSGVIYTLLILAVVHFLMAVFLVHLAHMKGRDRR